jgi:acetaldehyde dehydrogenase / alcohol dehydrogenase
MQALHLIHDSLPSACADGSDLEARTAMSNAATLAGLAFSNAFVGVCHSLAHAAGARFGIAHGRANGIFLPHVLRYNAAIPRKFMPAPGYTTYVAPDSTPRWRGCTGSAGQRGGAPQPPLRLRRDALGRRRHPALARGCRGRGAEFEAALPEVAEAAFMDPSMRTNPRMPLVAELVDLLRAGWTGR